MFASETLNVFLSPPSSKSAKNDSNSSTISPQKPEIDPEFDFERKFHPNSDIFDAILLVEGRKVYVGKQYLGTYSPFLNDLLEVIPEFEIPDVKFHDFIEFLHFLYPTDAEMTSSNVERLLNLAHRFEVEILKSKCEKFLISLDSMDTAWKLILAETFSLSRLQNHVLQNLTTEKDVQKVSKSAYYRQMTDTTKTSLLNRVLEIMEKKEDSDEDDDDEEEVSMPDESDDVIYVE
ncbi:hypothetical protein GCK72_015915 [Caenorhabditis remanei]|uniref:BTB domain-containing protein n=1 Tax=Caenorhabditis remanei TaxID=31234 RepID=A0A6A5GVE8_CAERE|nr:hypothetical protein GCK72_015915 [Caenorhabditis remanei]KAF1759448.1 hypothetical protein GCK72_015915 [Caenorhabditis remanei]